NVSAAKVAPVGTVIAHGRRQEVIEQTVAQCIPSADHAERGGVAATQLDSTEPALQADLRGPRPESLGVLGTVVYADFGLKLEDGLEAATQVFRATDAPPAGGHRAGTDHHSSPA